MATLSDQERECWCKDLNEEQMEVFAHYLNRDNIFMTGAGGCGKTYIIRRMYEHASTTGRPLQVCATTGCASILLQCNASTIHSWAGIGIGKGDPDNYIARIKRNKTLHQRWKATDTLIIDELSMLSKKLLSLLDYIGRSIRKRNTPFGGMQVIASGDFYQLPPVNKASDEPDEGAFAFELDTWTDLFPIEIELTNNHRQTDKAFTKALNEIRIGRLTRSSFNLLNAHVGRKPDPSKTHDIEPARLFPTRYKVNSTNLCHLSRLEEPEFVYKILQRNQPKPPTQTDEHGHVHTARVKLPTPTAVKQDLEFMIKHGRFEETLTLKKGAQVMSIHNSHIELGIVNGSLGRVKEFLSVAEYQAKYFGSSEDMHTRDVSGASNEMGGMCGVGRMGIRALPVTSSSTMGSMTLNTLKQENIAYPVVEFINGVHMCVIPHMWPSEKYGEFGIGILQLPLILAWAVSIHKSQGMTVDMAEIDVGRSIFECGQSYVALSRVKSLEGLFLNAFDISKIRINKKVQNFYKQMHARIQARHAEDESSEEEEEEEEDDSSSASEEEDEEDADTDTDKETEEKKPQQAKQAQKPQTPQNTKQAPSFQTIPLSSYFKKTHGYDTE